MRKRNYFKPDLCVLDIDAQQILNGSISKGVNEAQQYTGTVTVRGIFDTKQDEDVTFD